MPDSPVVAAVDLGSNSFRLQIARVMNSGLLPLDSLKESVRLGAGLDADKALTAEAQERALLALSRFGERLHGLPDTAVRAVATHAFRVATNVAAFLPLAEAELGFPIEVIGGNEEARLIFMGAAHTLPGRENRLVVDIGGGSTEFIVGSRFRPMRTESKQLGCVTWSQRFFADGKISPDRLAAAELAARERLHPMQQNFGKTNWERAIGCSGTARALAELAELNDFSPDGLTLASISALRERLLAAKHVDKVQLNGLRQDRRPVLLGGFAIMAAVFDMLGVERMAVASGALREGVLYDQIERYSDRDVRLHSVTQFQRRYHVDASQATRVAQLASELYARLLPEPNVVQMALGRQMVIAAQLHEVGLSISHVSYRRHSAYILQNADIAGFSRREQELLARFVLYHRGKLGRFVVEDFSKDERCALIALRLAVLFCRPRQDDFPPVLAFERTTSAFTLELAPDWLSSRPLTSHVLNEEIRLWQDTGVALNVIPLPLI